MHGRPTAPACVLFVCVFGVCAWKNDSVLHMHITPPLQHPCTPRVRIQVHMHTNRFEVSFYVRTCHLNFGRELLCLLQTINPLLHQLTQLLSIFVVLRLERVCECMSASVCARMAGGCQTYCRQEWMAIPACRNGKGPQFAQKKIHQGLPWGAAGARDVCVLRVLVHTNMYVCMYACVCVPARLCACVGMCVQRGSVGGRVGGGACHIDQ